MRIYVILFSIGLCFHSASQILADDADDDRMARMRDAANTLIGMTRRGELGAALMPNLGRGSADSADSRRNSENRVRIRAATRHIQDVAGHVQRMLRRLSTTTSQPMLQMLLPYLIESTGVVDGRDSRQMVQIGSEVLRMLREPMGVFAMSPVIMPLASQLDPSLRMLALEMMGTRGAPLGTRSVTSNEDVSLACEKLTCTVWEDKSFCSATCQNGPGFKARQCTCTFEGGEEVVLEPPNLEMATEEELHVLSEIGCNKKNALTDDCKDALLRSTTCADPRARSCKMARKTPKPERGGQNLFRGFL